MTILISGQGRGSGKTRAVCDIISHTSDARWTAIKITSHGHSADLTGPIISEERNAGPSTDTARYLAAGATRALWVRCNFPDIERALRQLIDGNTILESNSAVGVIPADLIVFVAGEGSMDSKPSARLASERADISVVGRLQADHLARIRSLLYHGR